MSILIKGMEMPTRCFNCGMCEVDDTQILCCVSHGSHVEYREIEEQIAIQDRPTWCPLIELPSHGRLIEDTVLDNMTMWNTAREYDRGWDSAVQAAKNRIKTAPTIIEAEGEDG